MIASASRKLQRPLGTHDEVGVAVLLHRAAQQLRHGRWEVELGCSHRPVAYDPLQTGVAAHRSFDAVGERHGACRVRRVRSVPRERGRVRVALRRPSDRPPRVRRASRRPQDQRVGVGHRGSRVRVPPRRGAERAHLGHGGDGDRPSARRDRPTRARSFRRSERGNRRSDRAAVACRRRRGRDPRACAERTRCDRHVARRAHHDRAHRGCPRVGAIGGARRRHARCRRREVEGDRRLHQRAAELPQLRRPVGADDPVQPDAYRVVPPPRDPPQRGAARRRFVGVAVRTFPHPAPREQ